MEKITKYYNFSIYGWRRIAAVDWFDEPDGRFGSEIPPNELPDGFEHWGLYQYFAQDNCAVRVMSTNGE